MEEQNQLYRTSRVLYIIEAALEYLISILVSGAFLAKLTSYLDLPDMLTGILSAFVGLGGVFQLVSLFWAGKRRVKRLVSLMHTVNQALFTFVYVVPVLNIPQGVKIVLFVVSLLGGFALNSMINSPKINWFMSLVAVKRRGRFTANKEIISLFSGMVFSYVMGAIIDRFEAAGDLRTAFVLSAVTLGLLTVLHTCTLVFSKEKETEIRERVSFLGALRRVLKNPTAVRAILCITLWCMASAVTTPFYGTYQIKELGFSMRFVSILSVVYAVVRAACSRYMGRMADRFGYERMMGLCLLIAAAGFGVNVFTSPSNGRILYTLYYVLYAIAMAGINNGITNYLRESVPPEDRMSAFSVQQAFSGLVSFLTTTVVGLLVAKIQADGNRFLGLSTYAQQVTSAISVLLALLTAALIAGKKKA